MARLGVICGVAALVVSAGLRAFAAEDIPVPRGDPAYTALCATHHLSCTAGYTGPQPLDAPGPSKPPEIPLPPTGGLQLGPWVVIGGVVAALALWLRFGGGALMARAPREIAPRTVPDGWEQQAAPGAPPFEAMEDRGRALVALLRLCLMAAADASATRLARSDTERTALRRLPQSLRDRSALEHLLHEAELAHYGGRAVPDDRFAALLATGRGFLRAQGAG